MFCLPAERKRQKTYTAVIKKHETFQVSYCEIPIISQKNAGKKQNVLGRQGTIRGFKLQKNRTKVKMLSFTL